MDSLRSRRWWARVSLAMVVLAVMGVVMYSVTVMVERSMTGWAQRSNMAAA